MEERKRVSRWRQSWPRTGLCVSMGRTRPDGAGAWGLQLWACWHLAREPESSLLHYPGVLNDRDELMATRLFGRKLR